MRSKVLNEKLDRFINLRYNDELHLKYPPDKIDSYIERIYGNTIKEIDINYENFITEFSAINYIQNTLIKLDIDYLLKVNYITDEELEILFDFNYFYYGESSYLKYEVIESNTGTASPDGWDIKKSYYRGLVINAQFGMYYYVFGLLNRFSDIKKFTFQYESQEELNVIIELNTIKLMVSRFSFENYDGCIRQYFNELPPLYYYQRKNSLINEIKEEFKKLIISQKNKKSTQLFLKTFKDEICKSKFLNLETEKLKIDLIIKKMYTEIDELITFNQDIFEVAKKSNNPDWLFFTLTKEDFREFFKDKNIDFAHYYKKMSDYKYIFKYEITIEYFNLIQSLHQENEIKETKEIINDRSKSQDKETKALRIKKKAPPNKFNYKNIFDEEQFEKFEKCYNHFVGEKNHLAIFSSMYHLLKEHSIIKDYVSHNDFIVFLEEHSQGRVRILQKQFKSLDVIVSGRSYKKVNGFINSNIIRK